MLVSPIILAILAALGAVWSLETHGVIGGKSGSKKEYVDYSTKNSQKNKAKPSPAFAVKTQTQTQYQQQQQQQQQRKWRDNVEYKPAKQSRDTRYVTTNDNSKIIESIDTFLRNYKDDKIHDVEEELDLHSEIIDPDMMNMLKALHTQQHPPKHTCKSRRLLVTQFAAKSFEGIGSILKMVMMGLAESAHANRTLIWGLDLPYMFEHSRGIWFSESHYNRTSYKYHHGYKLNCSDWVGRGGGAYACFFQSLSSCSLADLSLNELKYLGFNGYADDARIRIVEARRGISMYIPPVDMPRYKHVFKDIKKMEYPRQKWASAIGYYSFRLKPEFRTQLENRLLELWPSNLGGTARVSAFSCHSGCNDTHNKSGEIWGLHIRHGDTLSLKKEYGNRRTFDFEDYVLRAQDLSHALQRSPTSIYVTSDNPETVSYVKEWCSPKELEGWYGDKPPCIFTVNETLRFRTTHGSHTVAAEGGCTLGTCAMYSQDIIAWREKLAGESVDGDGVKKYHRIMTTLLEAIEDVYMLSRCPTLIMQGSSHFSSLSVLVSWAIYGADPSRITFLDEDYIASGLVQGSFLHGSLNGTSHLDPYTAFYRWTAYTRRFIESWPYDLLEQYARKGNGLYPFYPNKVEDDLNYRFHIDGKELIPTLPANVFKAEARRMLGFYDYDHNVWIGECPLPQLGNYQPLDQYIVDLVNHGAEQSNDHPNQSMRCWLKAQSLLERVDDEQFLDDMETLIEVLEENMVTLQAQQMYPYSMGEEAIKRLMTVNVTPKDKKELRKFIM